MGGDGAPEVCVAAAVAAAAGGAAPLLVGDAALLDPLLAAAGGPDVPVRHTPDVVGMAEEPALALRHKPEASIRVAMRAVAAGEAAAVVSAGSTGATLAAGLFDLGRLRGVRRPVIGALLPTTAGGHVVLVDAGATADAQPSALVESAAMGSVYAMVRGVAAPRIGLLNVGHERSKGNALARAAHDLLDPTPGFVGNVEPHHVIAGAVDVVVADGFTGNVLLKTAEAVAAALGGTASGTGPGGAVLLGVAGCVLVAHGAADATDLGRALATAAQLAAGGLVADLGAHLAPAAATAGRS